VRSIAFALFVVLSAAASAQPGPGLRAEPATVTGQVFDADLSVPVEYANVILYGSRDSAAANGTVTDAKGRFVITGVRPGRCRVEVSFMGYRTWSRDTVSLAPGATVDIGRINLRQTAIAVEGREVTAERPKLEYRIDKKVVNVASNPSAQNGTAVDALENAPGIKVDVENNVTLRGSGNFTVLIDGRPSLLESSEALQQLPAATIDRIEIITNPSAKYDPEGVSGIVNVILKKQRQSGLSGMSTITGGLDDKYGADLLANWRGGTTSAFFGANYNNMNFPGTRTVESWTESGDTVTHVNSTGTGKFGFKHYGLRAGTDFALGANDRMSLGARWGGRGGGRSQRADYLRWSEPGTDTTYYQGSSSSGRGGTNLSANLDETHTLGRPGHEVALRADYGLHNRSTDDTAEMRDSAGAIASGRHTTNAGPEQRLGIRLDYTLPLGRNGRHGGATSGGPGQFQPGQGHGPGMHGPGGPGPGGPNAGTGSRSTTEPTLEAGYQGRFNWSHEDVGTYEYVTDSGYVFRPAYSYGSDGRDNVQALYSTFSGSMKDFGFQLGLRGEYTDRAIGIRESAFKLTAWDLFPTLHLSHNLPADLQLMASYTRRIDRPRGWDLDPSEHWMDAYNVRRGNPALKPEYIDSYEGGVLWPFGENRVSLEGYYRATHNVSEDIASLYPGRPGVVLRTSENVGTDFSLGSELSLDLSPTRWWSLSLGGDVYDYRLEATIHDSLTVKTSFNWNANVSSDFTFPTGTRLQLRAQYEGPSVEAQGTEAAFFSTSISARQALFSRAFVLTVSVRDLFTSTGHEMTSSGDGFYTHFNFRRKSPVVTAGLTWNFNNYRPDRKARDREQEAPDQEEMNGLR
jgi:outer membrane cobalamin receptor